MLSVLPVLAASCLAAAGSAGTPFLDTTPDRVRSPLAVGFPRIGTVRPRDTREIGSSRITVGCETLDRDYTDFDQYRDYLPPLGAKKIRLQAGWAKIEKVPGTYDWAWLDAVIDFAVAHKIEPWLEASYGNPAITGGGADSLLNSLMTSPAGHAAWDRWIEAMVLRYRDRVHEWEIWNEPDHPLQKISPETVAELNVRTAGIIRRIQPGARIAALALTGCNTPYVAGFLKYASAAGKLDLFTWISFHAYAHRPEDTYGGLATMREMLAGYPPVLAPRQGESGAPSTYIPSFALAKYDWTEYTQAKWDLRRLLGDLGRDIETSVFTIIDIYYDWGKDSVLNRKGLIEADATKAAIRPKVAYYAVQNLTAIFDDRLRLAKEFACDHDSTESISLFGFGVAGCKVELVACWLDGRIPSNAFVTTPVTLTIKDAGFRSPVWVDLMTGRIHRIPKEQVTRSGDTFKFTRIPVYDSPVLIASAELIPMQREMTSR